MEDKHDHEMMSRNICIQMLDYRVHDEYNNLRDVHHHYRFVSNIKFRFQSLKEKHHWLLFMDKRIQDGVTNFYLLDLVNVAL